MPIPPYKNLLVPDLPLSTSASTTGKRGERQYIYDISSRLETSETLTVGRVISSDASIVAVLVGEPSASPVGQIPAGKGIWMKLQAQTDSTTPRFPLKIEYEGNSGSAGTINFYLQLVLSDQG